MTVRRATGDDIEAIREVAKRSWTTDYPDILTRETAETAVTDWYTAEGIAAELRDSRTLVLVAEGEDGGDGEGGEGENEAGDESSVVGFAHATWTDTDHEGYILRLYVDPDHRRENLGRDLLDRTVDALADAGVDRVNAMVLSANEPGRGFYEHFGFERVDEQPTTIGGESYPETRYVLEDVRDTSSPSRS
ncbi:GNAT family N-acetyltransferase [Halomarina rubra]|uniref:GNAT family N-acetyltransferase n=1 Tax=Halomarina rubra TaxID=2071873 RepID=A0ABD6AVY8_9EURY|nr:GNAT family N-acetyltransferase [Halomarina rubra]